MEDSARLVVGTTRASVITQQPTTEIHRALHAQVGYHALAGKVLGGRHLIRSSDLIAWLQDSPRPTDHEQAERLMDEPQLATRVFDIKAAAKAYSVGGDALRQQIAAGNLRAKRQGTGPTSKFLVSVKDLDAWFESLPDA